MNAHRHLTPQPSLMNFRKALAMATPSWGIGVRFMPLSYRSSVKMPAAWRLKRISVMISVLNSGWPWMVMYDPGRYMPWTAQMSLEPSGMESAGKSKTMSRCIWWMR